MMLVNAETMESPVTTVYRIAANPRRDRPDRVFDRRQPGLVDRQQVARARSTRNMLVNFTFPSSITTSRARPRRQSKPDCISTGKSRYHRNSAQAHERGKETQSQRAGEEHRGAFGSRRRHMCGVLTTPRGERGHRFRERHPRGRRPSRQPQQRIAAHPANRAADPAVPTMQRQGRRPAPADRRHDAAPGPAAAAPRAQSLPRRSTPPCPPPGRQPAHPDSKRRPADRGHAPVAAA